MRQCRHYLSGRPLLQRICSNVEHVRLVGCPAAIGSVEVLIHRKKIPENVCFQALCKENDDFAVSVIVAFVREFFAIDGIDALKCGSISRQVGFDGCLVPQVDEEIGVVSHKPALGADSHLAAIAYNPHSVPCRADGDRPGQGFGTLVRRGSPVDSAFKESFPLRSRDQIHLRLPSSDRLSDGG